MLEGEAWSGVSELGGDRWRWEWVWERCVRVGGVRKGGEHWWSMEVSVMRTYDGAGIYIGHMRRSDGVWGDICVTGGSSWSRAGVLEEGVSIDKLDESGVTALMWSIVKGNRKAAGKLRKAQAWTCKTRMVSTELMVARKKVTGRWWRSCWGRARACKLIV